MFNPADRSVENRMEYHEQNREQIWDNDCLMPWDEIDPSGGYDDGEFARFEDCDEYNPSDDFESGIHYDEYPEFDE